MPPKEATAGTPQDWLRRAKGNLVGGKCYLAQAAEIVMSVSFATET